MRKVGTGIPGAKEVVNEELAKIGRSGKGKPPTPTKKGGKKRKVETEEEDEEDQGRIRLQCMSIRAVMK